MPSYNVTHTSRRITDNPGFPDKWMIPYPTKPKKKKKAPPKPAPKKPDEQRPKPKKPRKTQPVKDPPPEAPPRTPIGPGQPPRTPIGPGRDPKPIPLGPGRDPNEEERGPIPLGPKDPTPIGPGEKAPPRTPIGPGSSRKPTGSDETGSDETGSKGIGTDIEVSDRAPRGDYRAEWLDLRPHGGRPRIPVGGGTVPPIGGRTAPQAGSQTAPQIGGRTAPQELGAGWTSQPSQIGGRTSPLELGAGSQRSRSNDRGAFGTAGSRPPLSIQSAGDRSVQSIGDRSAGAQSGQSLQSRSGVQRSGRTAGGYDSPRSIGSARNGVEVSDRAPRGDYRVEQVFPRPASGAQGVQLPGSQGVQPIGRRAIGGARQPGGFSVVARGGRSVSFRVGEGFSMTGDDRMVQSGKEPSTVIHAPGRAGPRISGADIFRQMAEGRESNEAMQNTRAAHEQQDARGALALHDQITGNGDESSLVRRRYR